jgi:hypothetical protein
MSSNPPSATRDGLTLRISWVSRTGSQKIPDASVSSNSLKK